MEKKNRMQAAPLHRAIQALLMASKTQPMNPLSVWWKNTKPRIFRWAALRAMAIMPSTTMMMASPKATTWFMR